MDLKIIDLSERHGKFILSGVRPDVANALRRCLMTSVPKMAIETVVPPRSRSWTRMGRVRERQPAVRRIVAHRLGLVPIPTDLDLYNYKDECACEGEGCPSCTIAYLLNKRGPGDVYSGDLEPLGGQELRVKDDLIPIVRLGPGQAILAHAFAELGTAKKHIKWQVTSGTNYRYYPTVDIDLAKCEGDLACVEACPRDVLKAVDGKPAVDDLEACILCRSCEEACEIGAIKVSGDDSKFLFEFETDGSLTARQTLEKALEILEKDFDNFREQVSAMEMD